MLRRHARTLIALLAAAACLSALAPAVATTAPLPQRASDPLYVSGGVAMSPDKIDHVEIIDFDGNKLVQVDV